MILKYVQFILLPSITYGGFIDPGTEEPKYHDIEDQIVALCKSLLYDQPTMD